MNYTTSYTYEVNRIQHNTHKPSNLPTYRTCIIHAPYILLIHTRQISYTLLKRVWNIIYLYVQRSKNNTIGKHNFIKKILLPCNLCKINNDICDKVYDESQGKSTRIHESRDMNTSNTVEQKYSGNNIFITVYKDNVKQQCT